MKISKQPSSWLLLLAKWASWGCCPFLYDGGVELPPSESRVRARRLSKEEEFSTLRLVRLRRFLPVYFLYDDECCHLWTRCNIMRPCFFHDDIGSEALGNVMMIVHGRNRKIVCCSFEKAHHHFPSIFGILPRSSGERECLNITINL